MFVSLSSFSSYSCSPQSTEGLAKFTILPQSPSLSITPPSSSVSVVSQTHSSYGPWGILGLCYILPYKQPNHHRQHAFIFPSPFSSYVYFYSLKQNRFLGSNWPGPTFSSFCGNHNIVFHEEVPFFLGNSLQTIWSGLLFWSKAVQSESRESRLKLRSWMLCWQGTKVLSLGSHWTYDPVRACVCVCMCVWERENTVCMYMCVYANDSFSSAGSWVFWNSKFKKLFLQDCVLFVTTGVH